MKPKQTNFQMIPRMRLPTGKRPMHMRLTTVLLEQFGVKKTHQNEGSKFWGKKELGYGIYKTSRRRNIPSSRYYDLMDEVKRIHREKIRTLHPDRGGCPNACAHFNALFTEIKRRLEPMLA